MATLEGQPYADGTSLVLKYLQAAFGSKYKAYFEGDPYDIPVPLLPCIVVAKQSGTTNPGPTGTNDITENIVVKVVMNKKDDFGAAQSYPNVDLTERKLRLALEGRDYATAAYLPGSICGILTTNITLGQQVLQMKLATAYMLNQRTQALLTSEGHVQIYLRERVEVLQRV